MYDDSAHTRWMPAWPYQAGPDVAPEPPPGLRRAQTMAKAAAMAGLHAARPGVSERAIEQAIGQSLNEQQATGIWTITNVGLGERAHICFPTQRPSGLQAQPKDVLIVDVHPITTEGFWGDCSRSLVIGDYPAAAHALSDLERLHYELLGQCQPGMPANELFEAYASRLTKDGFILLDLLSNIGHSLAPGAAYTEGFIDADNATAMWGAWAVEPFAKRDGIAVKVEDIVWFGRHYCEVL